MSRRDTSSRRMSLASALHAVAQWRAAGAQVGLASGAFDLVHAGHARALAAARGRLDRLVVAVTEDGAAARTLGPGRPVSKGDDRARVVASLRGVDAVVLTDESGLERLLHSLDPDASIDVIDPGLESIVWSRIREAGARG